MFHFPPTDCIEIHMNNKDLELVIFKVGEKFLQYVLNYHLPLIRQKKDDVHKFNNEQIKTIKKIISLIHQCEIASAQNPYSTIKQYLFNFGNIFNNMRQNCGGELINKSNSIELLDYLTTKAIEYYPSLLLIEEKKWFNHNKTDLNSHFKLSVKESEYIHNLLLKDIDFNNILSIKENPMFSNLNYKLENNISTVCFNPSFVSNFILRSFQNCCYRTKYDIQSFLNEIESQFSCLKTIAKGKSVEISNFCGIYGLMLDNIDEYKLSENIIIRNINEINNPGIKNTISIGSVGSSPKNVIGCTLEFKSIVNTSKDRKKTHPLDSTIVLSNSTSNDKFSNSNLFETILNRFISATIINLKSIYAPFRITFIDSNAPLKLPFPNIIENKYSNLSILKRNELDEIKEWFELLNISNENYIKPTLSRIKIAIYGRERPIDSILDTFIAWETMFSSKTSTTNSVVKSIKSILNRCNYDISNSRLSTLYGLRSNIVHGNHKKHKLLNVDNPIQEIENIKKEVIEIALIVLKELIRDKNLLRKTPPERVEILLQPETITCKKCDNKKFRFA